MKYIKLTKCYRAKVDDEDFEWLNQWKWYYHNGYAKRVALKEEQINNRKFFIYLHREIMNLPRYRHEKIIDHVNGNGLDNRRKNLQITNYSYNVRKGKQHGFSQYRGVYWYKRVKKWVSRIYVNKKSLSLGYFFSEKEAAKAYDQKVTEVFGLNGKHFLNFPTL